LYKPLPFFQRRKRQFFNQLPIQGCGRANRKKEERRLLRLTAGTGRTDPEKKDLMLFDDKSFRGSGLLIERTPGKLKNAIAAMAVEMMVMPFSGTLVQGAQSCMIDLVKPALVDQQLEIAIDRSLIERCNQSTADPQDVLNPQRSVLGQEYLFYCCPLCSFSLHDRLFVVYWNAFHYSRHTHYCKRIRNID
jgi:hypothetical protein